jgi:hypothetical protein
MPLRTLFAALVLGLIGFSVGAAELPTTTTSHSEPWQLVAMPGKSGWDAVRLNTSNGKAWVASQGKWKPLKEDGDGPTTADIGTYRCIGFRTTDDSWYALRFNVKTGKMWSLDADVWREFAVLEE